MEYFNGRVVLAPGEEASILYSLRARALDSKGVAKLITGHIMAASPEAANSLLCQKVAEEFPEAEGWTGHKQHFEPVNMGLILMAAACELERDRLRSEALKIDISSNQFAIAPTPAP